MSRRRPVDFPLYQFSKQDESFWNDLGIVFSCFWLWFLCYFCNLCIKFFFWLYQQQIWRKILTSYFEIIIKSAIGINTIRSEPPCLKYFIIKRHKTMTRNFSSIGWKLSQIEKRSALNRDLKKAPTIFKHSTTQQNLICHKSDQ